MTSQTMAVDYNSCTEKIQQEPEEEEDWLCPLVAEEIKAKRFLFLMNLQYYSEGVSEMETEKNKLK